MHTFFNFFFIIVQQSLVGQGLLTIAIRHTALGTFPLDEWSVRRRDLYYTTHTTHKKQISMCHWRYSNPQSQYANARRPTPSVSITICYSVMFLSFKVH